MRRSHTKFTPPLDWEVLERYFSGEASEIEAKAAMRMLTAYPNLAPLIERSISGPGTEFDTTTQFVRLRQHMEEQASEPSPHASGAVASTQETSPTLPNHTGTSELSSAGVFKRRISWSSALTGAGITGLAMAGLFALTRIGSLGNTAHDVGPLQEYATPKGARATVRLTDGTRVILAADSRLRYARSFGDNDRSIWLEGEAYLDIAPVPNKPFLVMAGSSVIRVLGTSFVIRARDDGSTVRVVVESGAVSFRRVTTANEASYAGVVTLRPGDIGQLENTGTLHVTHESDVRDYSAWTTGNLVMRATPLQYVIRDLERWYDLDIEVQDSSALNVPVTMTFDDLSADVGLQRLADALNMRYTRTGKTVRLTP